jgi:hypothetical protein
LIFSARRGKLVISLREYYDVQASIEADSPYAEIACDTAATLVSQQQLEPYPYFPRWNTVLPVYCTVPFRKSEEQGGQRSHDEEVAKQVHIADPACTSTVRRLALVEPYDEFGDSVLWGGWGRDPPSIVVLLSNLQLSTLYKQTP